MPKGPAEAAPRPVLEVTCCIAHGHGIFVYVSDEHLRHGSDWMAEVVLSTLDQVECFLSSLSLLATLVHWIMRSNLSSNVQSHMSLLKLCSQYRCLFERDFHPIRPHSEDLSSNRPPKGVVFFLLQGF